jgi:hypothetical protein
MVAPNSNSERKASSYAQLSLRGLRSRVPRAGLRQAALYTERLEPRQRPETLAEVSPRWSILRSMPAKACAHVYEQRTDCYRAWAFITAVVPSSFLRTQELDGMAEDTAAANRASNGGNRLATHTTGAAPRPASQGGRSNRHGAPRAVGAEVNPRSFRARCLRAIGGIGTVCLWCRASV